MDHQLPDLIYLGFYQLTRIFSTFEWIQGRLKIVQRTFYMCLDGLEAGAQECLVEVVDLATGRMEDRLVVSIV